MTEPHEIEITKTGDDKLEVAFDNGNKLEITMDDIDRIIDGLPEIKIDIDVEKANDLRSMLDDTIAAWQVKHYPESPPAEFMTFEHRGGEREIVVVLLDCIEPIITERFFGTGECSDEEKQLYRHVVEKVLLMSHNGSEADGYGPHPLATIWDGVAGQPITAEPKPST
jgi:hypothetical protein